MSSAATTERTSTGSAPRRLFALARLESVNLAWATLALALLAAAVLIYHLTRGNTFWFDEWLWIAGRRGNSVSTFLDPYNSHLSLVPIALYRLLFATAGIHTYVPYRLMIIAGHIACVVLLYIYARHRVGDYMALLGALLILFLGPAWENILWPFQIAWLLSIAAGIGTFLMLDRHDRRGDVAACLLLILSLASTSVGLAFALGAVVDIAGGRRRWRDAWIVALPLALYALWSLAYQHTSLVASDVFLIEQFVASSAAASLSSLLGLAAQTPGQDLTLGAPLALLGITLLAWLAYRRRWSVRSASLMTGLIAFWVLTAIGRAFFGRADAPRYLYVDGIFVVLLAAELARGTTWKPRIGIPLTVIVTAAIVSNIGIMRTAAASLRAAAPKAKAELAALNLSRPFIGPDYVAASFPDYPLIVVSAGRLFAAEHSLGSPADSVAQLATAPDFAREVADAELVRAQAVRLQASATQPTAGPPPAVNLASGGVTTTSGSCVSFRAGPEGPGQVSQLQVTVPGTGVRLLASDAPATVGVRRFADGFQPLGTLPSSTSAIVRIRADGATQPWHVQLVIAGRATVCGISG